MRYNATPPCFLPGPVARGLSRQGARHSYMKKGLSCDASDPLKDCFKTGFDTSIAWQPDAGR